MFGILRSVYFLSGVFTNVRCVIWYHLYNLKNVKNTQGEVLLFVKPATLLKVSLLHGCFSLFLNCTNATKSLKASQMVINNINGIFISCSDHSTGFLKIILPTRNKFTEITIELRCNIRCFGSCK